MAEDKREIFVFGSNEAGRHGAGAAKFAVEHHGAIYGQGVGLQGDSYGIPTKDRGMRTLPLCVILPYVREFVGYARGRPDLYFNVTRIGCGLAGYTDQEIAPLFFDAPDNCHLPDGWRALAGARARASQSENPIEPNSRRNSTGDVSMTKTNEQVITQIMEALAEPFHPDHIRWRVPANTIAERAVDRKRIGRAFAYLDARAVSDRLNAVLGTHWSSSLAPLIEGGRVTGFSCSLSITLPDGSTATRTDVGVGETSMPDDLYIKAAASDALKRAAVHFGIGRYLYDLDQPKVEVDSGGYISGPRPELPDWALPRAVLVGLDRSVTDTDTQHEPSQEAEPVARPAIRRAEPVARQKATPQARTTRVERPVRFFDANGEEWRGTNNGGARGAH